MAEGSARSDQARWPKIPMKTTSLMTTNGMTDSEERGRFLKKAAQKLLRRWA
jgi:hypothetical protein